MFELRHGKPVLIKTADDVFVDDAAGSLPESSNPPVGGPDPGPAATATVIRH